MKKYLIARPHIGKKEERYVLEVLRSGILSIGPKIEAFEKSFAKFVGVKYAVGVSSGTAGLHMAMIAAGIGPGDEVITSPFSFVASANVILYVSAKPVFVDIDPITYNMDPKKIKGAITKKTKAILVVHIFGQSVDMSTIMRIAKKHKLKVVEDACESLGARHNGRTVGTFGESAVFAFYPNKQMTTGEGGMVTTNSKKLDTLFRSLRNQGRAADMGWLDHERLGYNYRLDEMSAAVGLAQIEKINFLIKERQKIAGWYNEYLSRYPSLISIPRTVSGNNHTWFVYVPLIVNKKIGLRDRLTRDLKTKNIASKHYLPSIHLMSFYKKEFGYKKGDFPVSEDISSRGVALPIYIGLTKSDTLHIARNVIGLLAQYE